MTNKNKLQKSNHSQHKYAPKNLDAMRETKCSRSEPVNAIIGVEKLVNVSEKQNADRVSQGKKEKTALSTESLETQNKPDKTTLLREKGSGFAENHPDTLFKKQVI